MSSSNLASPDDGDRERAVERLRAVVAERSRVNRQPEGTGAQVKARASKSGKVARAAVRGRKPPSK